ncbi:MAG TPA: alpha/beta hydrolase [Ktedonobacter sp.]|nr:alpha/beta hydrolase [Ktedonobacter sp.]
MPQQKIRISYGPESLQFGDLYIPSSSSDNTTHYPVVILIHGGFWRNRYTLSLMEGLAQDLAARGIAAWNIEYRRIGDAGGGWPNTMLDVARATDFLRTIAVQHNLDMSRVVPIGHSAGGHLAFWLAARKRILRGELNTENPLPLTGAISLAGAVDLELTANMHLGNDAAVALLGGTPQEVPERYATASPAALLPLGVPQVLIHGTNDDNVPIKVSREYYAKARLAKDDIQSIEIQGADHFVLIDPTSKAWETTIRELQNLVNV